MLRGGFLLGRVVSRHVTLKRPFASLSTEFSQLPKPGEKLHGFTVQRVKQIPELQLAAVQLEHDKTGAEYIHIARDDKNNVFSMGFKTNPTDDTGTPHILEHVTLCGSEKYPVRDPFFKMLNRSLSNFMNAFTSADHTTYPFATTNPVDYYNLMDVYLDATLFPLLQESDFKQEGWRIGPENVKDKSSPLQFKGVVYNEMKGQMSDSSYLYYIRYQDHIFPSLHNSGGDPPKIPDLTLEQLREFHRQHYHPSNAKVFTYGNFCLHEHLKKVNEKLSLFDRIKIDRELKQPITIEGPMDVKVLGPVDPLMERTQQFKTSISWIMNDTSDVVETFGLRLLSSLLIDGYGSPMYQGLIESKLGSDFSPNTGYSASSKRAIFSLGLQRVKEEDLPKVSEKIKEILARCHKKGFEQRKIDGILHQLELSLKHKTATFGISVMQRLKSAWFNGVDPFDVLAWEDTLSRFKEQYAKGGYFEGLIKKYLLNDRHMTFTMIPSEDYTTILTKEGTARLEEELKNVKREELEKQEAELIQIQEAARKQDLSCLPTLRVSDISREMERKELLFGSLGGVGIQWRLAPTNGLTYFRAINVFEDLPDNLRLYLPLFTEAIFKLGTKTKSIEEIEDTIKLKTGGISTSLHISTNHSDLNKVEQGLAWSGYCLDSNLAAMYELLRTVLTETDFDQPTKLNVLVQGIAGGFVDTLAESGHSYARLFAGAHLTPAGKLSEVTGGMTQVRLLSNLAATRDYSRAIGAMKEIAKFAASKSSLRAAITCSVDSQATNETALASFLKTLPVEKAPVVESSGFEFGPETHLTFFPLPYQVSYTSMATRTVPYTHKDGPALQILSQLLTHKHLHHEIREKGGAYGGGAFHQGIGGVFGYYSYRDPNVPNTLNIMKASGKWAAENSWTESDLEEAKLAVFQGVDAPTSVNEEGMVRFVHGITDDMRQARRENLLDITANDVKEVAYKYLVGSSPDSITAVAVLGEKKDYVEKDGFTVLDMSIDEAAMKVPEIEELAPKVEL
ncbi:peptidase M16C associated-domain-containing protein [Kalaharituber pfeilii]|nr:peptidase M16C associated-domain-containing protein [Kalaharituber pfeilii]